MDKKFINIGLIGYGTVGKGALQIIEENKKIIARKLGLTVKIKSICDLKPIDKPELYVKNFKDIIKDPEIDIIVELIGGYEPARTIITESLKAGKNVITANKAVLAKYWDQIFTLAKAVKKSVYFEAAVGGVMPVVQGLSEGLSSIDAFEIKGILNGTTNFILSEMTKNGVSYEQALEAAQKAGFAEADPSFDVKGIDTANKLAILSSLAWDSWIKVKDIKVSGISNLNVKDVLIAKDLGYDIKLIGSAEKTKGGIDLSVEPRLVSHDNTFATVENEYNAVKVKGKDSDDVLFYGKGAGARPAASAVVSDIVNLCEQIVSKTAGIVPEVVYDPKKKVKLLPSGKSRGAYYLRFVVEDKPGALAKISTLLGSHKVSIASLFQRRSLENNTEIIITTHKTRRENLEKAIKQIDATRSVVKARTVRIKIEE
ncbi:MAG: homoserine dehydrogenase [Elusimicrobia bacterium]|nr:homoserine dehydrogenase [Elusimicrobiota bacterium]